MHRTMLQIIAYTIKHIDSQKNMVILFIKDGQGNLVVLTVELDKVQLRYMYAKSSAAIN